MTWTPGAALQRKPPFLRGSTFPPSESNRARGACSGTAQEQCLQAPAPVRQPSALFFKASISFSFYNFFSQSCGPCCHALVGKSCHGERCLLNYSVLTRASERTLSVSPVWIEGKEELCASPHPCPTATITALLLFVVRLAGRVMAVPLLTGAAAALLNARTAVGSWKTCGRSWTGSSKPSPLPSLIVLLLKKIRCFPQSLLLCQTICIVFCQELFWL